MNITFLGGGNMATALIGGLVGRGAAGADGAPRVTVIDPAEAQRERAVLAAELVRRVEPARRVGHDPRRERDRDATAVAPTRPPRTTPIWGQTA